MVSAFSDDAESEHLLTLALNFILEQLGISVGADHH